MRFMVTTSNGKTTVTDADTGAVLDWVNSLDILLDPQSRPCLYIGTYNFEASISAEGTPTIATSLGVDATTKGNWASAYGKDGHQLCGADVSLPAYADVQLGTWDQFVWGSGTGDACALKTVAKPGDIEAAYLTAASADITVSFSDGFAHQVAIYALDWDNLQGSPLAPRSQRFDVLNASTGDILATCTISTFVGVYCSFLITGKVIIRVTNLTPPGKSSNAVVSGLFFSTPTTS
jgi:hypothetical protein